MPRVIHRLPGMLAKRLDRRMLTTNTKIRAWRQFHETSPGRNITVTPPLTHYKSREKYITHAVRVLCQLQAACAQNHLHYC